MVARMAEKLRLRCSALPLAFLCPGSVRPSKLSINETNTQAETGTAAHAALRRLVEVGVADWDSVPDLARRHGANENELRILIAQATKLWNQVKESFPAALTEVSLSYDGLGFEVTGHADILGSSGDHAYVGDWKTGRLDADYREQILGYCALALLEDHTLEQATAGILWIRDGEYEQHTMRRSQLEDWLARLATEILEWKGTYKPGPHCAHCRRNHECDAANALMRRDLAIVTDRNLVGYAEDGETLDTWTNEAKIDLVEKARVASHLIERVLGALKADVVKNGGEISDGKRRLVMVTEQRRSLDPIKAFPVLTAAGFDDEDMAQVISMSASKAESVVRDKSQKGKGAAAVRELQSTLEAAGAIRVSEFSKMIQRRA
jgi:hypothetical protein